MDKNTNSAKSSKKQSAGRLRAKKPRLRYEEVKARHTSHWDLDYLPLSELDKLMNVSSVQKAVETPKKSARYDKAKLLTALLSMALGLTVLATGLYFLLKP